MLEDQNGNCAQCSEKKTVDEVQAHHKNKRHADGGETVKENGAAVCTTCHKNFISNFVKRG